MRMLGHEFKEMTLYDWNGFAGADAGSLIAHCDDCVLIWSPQTGEVTEITSKHGEYSERTWTPGGQDVGMRLHVPGGD